MNIQKLYERKDELCRELENAGSVNRGNLDDIYKLTSAMKNLCKIIKSEEMSGEYSNRNSYDGYSNAHYVRGHYSRDGYSRDDYSRDSYSRTGSRETLERMMENAKNREEREAIQHCLNMM